MSNVGTLFHLEDAFLIALPLRLTRQNITHAEHRCDGRCKRHAILCS